MLNVGLVRPLEDLPNWTLRSIRHDSEVHGVAINVIGNVATE